MELLDKKVVEATAHIMGSYSGAAKALEDSKNYDDPVFIRANQSIIVTERNTWENMKNEAT